MARSRISDPRLRAPPSRRPGSRSSSACRRRTACWSSAPQRQSAMVSPVHRELLAVRVDQVDGPFTRYGPFGRVWMVGLSTVSLLGMPGDAPMTDGVRSGTSMENSQRPVNWTTGQPDSGSQVTGRGRPGRRPGAPGHQPRGVEPRGQQERRRPPARGAAVIQSTTAARPSCQVTTAISATEAAFAPSRNPPAQVRSPEPGNERARQCHEHEGRQEDRHGRHDRSRHPGQRGSRRRSRWSGPGPGVNWPTATASRSWPSVSQPVRSTRSGRRNARRT